MAGVVRETLYYTIGLVAMRAISLIMLPVTTAFLSSAQYGRLEVLLSFADIGTLLFGLALPSALARFVGDVPDWEGRKAVCAEYAGLSLLVSAILVTAGVVFAHPVIGILPEPMRRVEYLLLLATICVEGVMGVGLTWLRIRGAAPLFLGLSLGRAAIQASLTATFLILGYGVEGVLMATATAALLQAAAMIAYLVRDCGIAVRFARWREMVWFCGPLLLSGLAAFALGSFDRWVLAGAVPPEEIALYGVAIRLGAITAVLLQPFHMWWFPKRFMVYAEPDGAARSARIVAVGYLIVLAAAVVVSLGGPFAVHVLTRAAYHGATAYIVFLALIYAIQETGSLLEIGCYLRKDGFAPLVINLIGAGVAIALYYLLIPRYGVPGAIAATLVAQVVKAGLGYVVSVYYAPIPYPFAPLGAVTLLTVVLVALSYRLLPPLLLPLAGPAVLGAAGLLAWRLGQIPQVPREELPPAVRRLLRLG